MSVFLAFVAAVLSARYQIKDGWGWVKWDCDTWGECPMADRKGEDVQDRYFPDLHYRTTLDI